MHTEIRIRAQNRLDVGKATEASGDTHVKMVWQKLAHRPQHLPSSLVHCSRFPDNAGIEPVPSTNNMSEIVTMICRAANIFTNFTRTHMPTFSSIFGTDIIRVQNLWVGS